MTVTGHGYYSEDEARHFRNTVRERLNNLERVMNEPQHHHKQYATREDMNELRQMIKRMEKKLDQFTTGLDRSDEMPQSIMYEPEGPLAELVENHGPAYP